MGREKYPFDHVETLVAAAGSNDVEMYRVPPGQLVCVQRCSVENETNGAADVRIKVKGGGMDLLIAEEDALQAATLYWVSDPIYLHEGQYLCATLTGCTASDYLRLYVRGWWIQLRDGGN